MLDLDHAQSLLLLILEEQAELLGEAKGFGLRVAAYPKGLMPLKEAQRIIADMGKNVEKLDLFVHSLLRGLGDVPPEFAFDVEALVSKTKKAQVKCHADLKQAREALEQYEDLLVGEAFQEAFQAVRIAIINLDPADGVDLDYKTGLHLDMDPSYASGEIRIQKDGVQMYTVRVGYRAVDDYFYGNITTHKKGKEYREVVRKHGHTKLPAFVRELTDQLKALSDADGAGVFTSRKKVELTLVDPRELGDALKPLIQNRLKEIWGAGMPYLPNVSLTIDPSGKVGVGTSQVGNGMGWDEEMHDLTRVAPRFQYFAQKRAQFATTFDVSLPNGQVWQVESKPQVWEYRVQLSKGRLNFSFVDWDELAKEWPPEYDFKSPISVLRARAQQLGVPFDPKSKSIAALAEAIRKKSPPPKNLRLGEGGITLTLTRKDVKKQSAIERIAAAFLRLAGAQDFGVYSRGKDVGRAFQDAVAGAQYERGHGGYSGSMAEKSEYIVRRRDPFVWDGRYPMPENLRAFIHQDMDHPAIHDKWGPAGAVPVSEEKVLAKDEVTVSVEAKNEVEARRKGIQLIKATGRVPPKATILVEVPEGTRGITLVNRGTRVPTWTVKGLRKQAIVGEITGWYFYGYAPS